jgi:hypothetical protein
MGRKFSNAEKYENQEVYFMYEGQEVTWYGDYGVHIYGEEWDWNYPGDCECDIEILHTERIEMWSEEKEEWVPIKETPSILTELAWQIEKDL